MADEMPVLPTDAHQLLMCKVLLAENVTPWRRATYQEDACRKSMRAMRACVENRLTEPGLFAAPGASSWTDVIVAPGQFRGFHRENGLVRIAEPVQRRLDQILGVDVHRREFPGKAMRAFVRMAIETATAASKDDPFDKLPESLGQPPVRIRRGTYGWRTDGHPMTGRTRFVLIPASQGGVLLANQFYTLRA